MATRTAGSVLTLGLAVFSATVLAQSAAPPASGASDYAWAESCRTCHEAVYQAWAKTKHASALNRLSAADQETPCVGCHVTGPKTRVFDGKIVLNRGVQCEACHGGGAAHAADPAVRVGLKKQPKASLCEDCHSDKGPRFKGFFHSAMVGLSHKHS